MSMYGMAQPTKAGHWLCTKCNTWNREYNNASKKVVCPLCSAPKPITTNETAKGGEPTQVDKDLFAFLKDATDEQVTKIQKFININSNIFEYMKTAPLVKKIEILEFVEDELL